MSEATATLDALAPMLIRWTMGGAAAGAAPPAWSAAAGTDPREAELRLLAFAGQFLGTMVIRDLPGTLAPLPDLPALALPPAPEALRPLVRRIIRTHGERDLLVLLTARGRSVHPGDWLPSAAVDDLPDVYAPWRDWAETAGGPSPLSPGDDLTESTWAEWGASARRAELKTMRRRNPAAARDLIAACAGSESADTRLRLNELLADGLSDADRPYLESLVGDRAPRVKALAAAYLARLGHGAGTSAEAAELAGFFEIKAKGLLRRTRVVTARPIKTAAQRAVRDRLFEAVDFTAFAAALDLAIDSLLTAWPFEDAAGDAGLAAMIARSGGAAAVTALLDALMAEPALPMLPLRMLTPRLSGAQRRAVAERAVGPKRLSFEAVLNIAGAGTNLEELIDRAAGDALLAACSSPDAKLAELAPELHALGLLASARAARDALARLTAGGLLGADPRLDMLRLNAALPTEPDQ